MFPAFQKFGGKSIRTMTIDEGDNCFGGIQQKYKCNCAIKYEL